ncbi:MULTISPECIES: DUF742 domain-containing protein [Streptomyces]|uniref:DUF742 domain-containing protein n=1 Tax=Streptomyces sp. R33 TaxID=3238629 RepID=A0AB39Y0S1_9ACTN|nr:MULTISPECIES: DUF742 domain-containing protein [Streptomyces]KJY46758.1 hypothetical protein VR46_07325 [Streptomyces sp. NRRL S-444]KOY54077.1 hypothetical protein ADK59_32060 [Streptomyces sp. XY332]TDU74920.1 uncharacterized protein DUF742 [Streptomyces sp. KS 21]THA37583.1 DUF742 domain-containing protein [Streptomyces sp. A1547]
MSNPGGDWEDGTPERLYVITGGRSGGLVPTHVDLVTLIIAKSGPRPGMQPEHAAIMRLCQSPLSVAEISAYLGLPVSVVTVLLGDLLAAKHVLSRPPVAPAKLPDLALIEAVIDGLRKL